MDKSYERQLLHRFRNLTAGEVLQEIRIAEAEAEGRGKRLSFTIALRNLLDLERKRMRFERWFTSWEEIPTGVHLRAAMEHNLFEAFLDEIEWREIIRRQPLPVRKLVDFARYEAERFEDVPYGVWYLHNLMELRRRVKRRWLEWDRDHSEKSYERARATLVSVLRAHGGKRA